MEISKRILRKCGEKGTEAGGRLLGELLKEQSFGLILFNVVLKDNGK